MKQDEGADDSLKGPFGFRRRYIVAIGLLVRDLSGVRGIIEAAAESGGCFGINSEIRHESAVTAARAGVRTRRG